MPRTLAATSLFVLVTLSACKEPKGVEIDARHLIPVDANAVFGFELDPLRNSPIGPMLHASMQSAADTRGMLASVASCNVDLANLRGVFATLLEADDRFMAVVEAPNIGEEDTVRCMEKEFAKATGEKDGILLFETKGEVRATPQEGGGYLIILNKNTIAVVDKPWEAAVFAAIETPASRNTTTPLAKTLETIDPKTDLWFAMSLSDSDRASFVDVKGADGIAVATATADLTSGIELDVRARHPRCRGREGARGLVDDAARRGEARPGRHRHAGDTARHGEGDDEGRPRLGDPRSRQGRAAGRHDGDGPAVRGVTFVRAIPA